MMKKIYFYTLFFILTFLNFAEENPGIGIGANAAYPAVENTIKTISIPKGTVYTIKDAELEKLIDTAANIQINLFELFDCVYRYLIKNNMRIKMIGSSLVKLNYRYIVVENMMEKLLPIDKIDYIESGVILKRGQNAIDIFLTEKHSADFEVGKGFYETHFGFKNIEPLNFSNCFGLSVKAKILNIKMQASKLHLYDRGKGAFYVKGFYKPKRWYLNLIKKR